MRRRIKYRGPIAGREKRPSGQARVQVYRARGQARYNGEDEDKREEEKEDGTRRSREKRRVARPTKEEGKGDREKERRLSRSLKCVGECELVSRESPLSVALGVPPSVILSVRPYFVARTHTHRRSRARTRPYTCARASAFRQSQNTKDDAS